MLSAIRSWYKFYNNTPPTHVSKRGIRVAVRQAFLLAAVWAFLPISLLPSALPDQQVLLCTIVVGMICAGGFALSAIRGAGIVFPVTLGIGSVIGLLMSDMLSALPMVLLLITYVLTVVFSVINAADTFKARVISELHEVQQRQVISLLLNDFEKHSADVLWEIDSDLKLRNVSNKLSELFCVTKDSLNNMNLLSFIAKHQTALPNSLQDEVFSSFKNISMSLKGVEGFRDIKLPLSINGHKLWWSFTAQKLPDDGWRGVISDITVIHMAQQNVWKLAHYDAVTGLANRHRFQEVLEDMINEVNEGNRLGAVLCIDLDGFKSVNDTMGHNAGDTLLSIIGHRLQSQAGQHDLVARIGGDEFGIILRYLNQPEEAITFARDALQTLQTPIKIEGSIVPINACIGVSYAPTDGENPDIVLKNADLALYAGKADGQGQLRCFTQPMRAQLSERLKLEHALQDALIKEQLYLVYQPKYHLKSKSVVSFEALVRWKHPELGNISPEIFIPVAEKCGYIEEIGRWVLNEACYQASFWPDSVSIAVNVSALQLTDKLIPTIKNILEKHNIQSHRLELEITESVLLNDAKAMLDILHQLQRLDINIALDDFGTGYSAMSYLRRFPFNTLKIDRMFIKEIVDEPDALAIVQAIIGMAQTLNMVVVAEGVESLKSLNLLEELRCDIIQGYFISPPVSLNEVPEFLRDTLEAVAE
jgi:diguanylate cyclase (GGDEF)-like protein